MKTLIEYRPPPPWDHGPHSPTKLPLKGPWIALPLTRMNSVARLEVSTRNQDGLEGSAKVAIEARDRGVVSTVARVEKPAPKGIYQQDRVGIRFAYIRAIITAVGPETHVHVRLDV